MAIVITDVAYGSGIAAAAAVVADTWTDKLPASEFVETVQTPKDYVPGEFFRRELPALLAVLERARPVPECVVIDGYVWLAQTRPGLGMHLYEALGGAVPVVGVAKNPFANNDACTSVFRGSSSRPLYVTANGMGLQEAAARVEAMHGPHRIPALLKRADRACREHLER